MNRIKCHFPHRPAYVQAERQQDTLYGVEFQLVVLERKMARAQGIVSREEAERLAARIKELGSLLAAAQAEQTMLTGQVKRVDDDCGELLVSFGWARSGHMPCKAGQDQGARRPAGGSSGRAGHAGQVKCFERTTVMSQLPCNFAVTWPLRASKLHRRQRLRVKELSCCRQPRQAVYAWLLLSACEEAAPQTG